MEEVVANVLGQAGFVGEIMFALPGLHVVNSFTRSDQVLRDGEQLLGGSTVGIRPADRTFESGHCPGMTNQVQSPYTGSFGRELGSLSRFGWLLLGAATGCHRFAFQDFFTRPTARQKDVVALCRIVLIATFLDVFDAGLFVRYCHTANFDRELLPSCHLISFDGCI